MGASLLAVAKYIYYTVFINHNCNTSCELIQEGLFTSWTFGFVFDPLRGVSVK